MRVRGHPPRRGGPASGYASPMRVAFTGLWHPPGLSPADVLSRDTTRRGLGAALAARGHDVTVLQEHPQAAEIVEEGVRWRFVPPSPLARASRRALAAAGASAPIVLAPATHLLAPLRALAPDVVHCFDASFTPTLALLVRLGPPVVTHYHGGEPTSIAGLRAVQRAALARVARLLFTTADRAAPFVRAGADPARIVELPETSTRFTPGDRAGARARTGLHGDPAILCPGRLDAVKDPLTTIRGVARVAEAWPGTRLHLAYTDAPMEAEVRAEVARHPPLAGRVTFWGRVAHATMEDLLRAADLVVQSSVREVCGIATLEAAAVGTPVVLSDIPPFRRLTDDGRFGGLFPVGDADALARAVLTLRPATGAALRARFEARYSFAVLAASVERVYADVTAPPN